MLMQSVPVIEERVFVAGMGSVVAAGAGNPVPAGSERRKRHQPVIAVDAGQ